MFGATPAFNQAIPTQKLESPAKAQPQQWRPSPGFRPSPAGDPKPDPTKPAGGKRGSGGPGTSDVPWESAPTRINRIMSERAYNKNLAGTNANNANMPTSTTSRKSYKLTGQEIQANKDREAAAAAARKKEIAAHTYTPAQRAEVKKKIERANADSALAGGGVRRGDRAGQANQRMR